MVGRRVSDSQRTWKEKAERCLMGAGSTSVLGSVLKPFLPRPSTASDRRKIKMFYYFFTKAFFFFLPSNLIVI